MTELTDKLKPFIFKLVKNHRTSLGENDAFPPEEDYPFDYKILKERYQDIIKNIVEYDGIDNYDEEFLTNRLEELIKICQEIEEPIRPNLEKICTNVILRLFSIPSDTVDFNAKLVDEVQPEKQFRIKPEVASERKFDFESLDDFSNANKSVLKRRLINALIQGASYTYSHIDDLYLHDVYKIDKRLVEIYSEISVINDYLLFIKEEKITDEHPMQGGCVDVFLGSNKNKTKINAQGLIFPFLLHELIRGFLELFASHGLPSDNDKAKYILGQADFLMAEPWDLRMGVGLWEPFSKKITDTSVLPYFFMNLCCLPTQEFNDSLKEIFAHTKKGDHILNHMVYNAELDLENQGFVSSIDLKNAEVSLIADGTFSIDEINGMIQETMQDNINKNIFEYPDGELYHAHTYQEVTALLDPILGEEIAHGSSRIVYEIDDNQVLKVAYSRPKWGDDKQDVGIQQNKAERLVLTNEEYKIYTIFPKFYYACPSDRWIVVERVIPASAEDFYQTVGMHFDKTEDRDTLDVSEDFVDYYTDEVMDNFNLNFSFKDFILWSWRKGDDDAKSTAYDQKFLSVAKKNRQLVEIFKLVKSHKLALADLYAMSSWGIVNRNNKPSLVLLDSGLNMEVLNKYYEPLC